jgi:hypothetical protein
LWRQKIEEAKARFGLWRHWMDGSFLMMLRKLVVIYPYHSVLYFTSISCSMFLLFRSYLTLRLHFIHSCLFPNPLKTSLTLCPMVSICSICFNSQWCCIL